MKCYYVRLRSHSPVSISGHQNLDGQTIPSTDYVPGATLRGALAWNWLRRRPDVRTTSAFRRLFDEGGFRCGPLYPISGAQDTVPASLVLPVTARTCKHHQGFITDPQAKPTKVHGVRDSLLALIEETAQQQRWTESDATSARETMSNNEVEGLSAFESCEVQGCTSGMERFGGYYEIEKERTRYRRVSVRKRLITRSQVLPTLESTRPGALFSREVIEEGQEFAGWIEVEADLSSAFDEMVATDEIYVGAARTAGMGQMQFVERREHPDLYKQVHGDFAVRRAQSEQRLAHISAQTNLAFVPITLLSDTILLDAHLRHINSLSKSALTTYAQMERLLAIRTNRNQPPAWPGDLQLFCSAAYTRRIASRNTAQTGQRPRSDDWAIGAGSVFVLAAPADERESLWRACAWLEENAVGERRNEGFGRVLAAHPFHFADGGRQCL